jgi:hypothetical protein
MIAQNMTPCHGEVMPWLPRQTAWKRRALPRVPQFQRLTLLDTLLRRFARTRAWSVTPGLPVLARRFVIAEPPRVPILAMFGSDFPGFLAEQPELADRPWLAELARLEWVMHLLRMAPDVPEFTASRLAAIPPSQLQSMVLKVRPTFLPFASRWPVLALFDGPADGVTAPLRPQPVHLVLRRDPDSGIARSVLEHARFVFLRELAGGATVGLAARTAAARDPGFDLPAAFGQLVAMGAFAAPDDA